MTRENKVEKTNCMRYITYGLTLVGIILLALSLLLPKYRQDLWNAGWLFLFTPVLAGLCLGLMIGILNFILTTTKKMISIIVFFYTGIDNI